MVVFSSALSVQLIYEAVSFPDCALREISVECVSVCECGSEAAHQLWNSSARGNT